MRKLYAFLVILFLVINNHLIAQISKGGVPESFQQRTEKTIFETVIIAPPALNQIAADDSLADGQFKPRRFSVLLPVNKNLASSGTWTILPDGSQICRMKIKSENALAISLYFDDFHLADNARLFLYDEKGLQLKGAYTSYNNHLSRLFATELIYGDVIIVELNGSLPGDNSSIHYFRFGLCLQRYFSAG